MKDFKYLFVFIFLFVLFNISVKANSISKISMDIYVDSGGNAHITEIWNVKLDEGTEGYHPFYNMDNSYISDFSVSDDKGNNYTFIDNWNINASFDSKQYKNGIYKSDNEVDICWGISEYGNRVYTLKYTINNFIYNTIDGVQILFWQLLPQGMNPTPKDVYIKIYGDNKFEKTLGVWGYGNYGGTAYVHNGYIDMKSPKNGFDSSDYMTVLVKFPKDYFNTTNMVNKSWNEIFANAEEGAVKFNKDSNEDDVQSNGGDKKDVKSDINASLNDLVEDVMGKPSDSEIVKANNEKSKENMLVIIIISLSSVLVAVLIILFVYKKKSDRMSNL